jgi:hypothetical protein
MPTIQDEPFSNTISDVDDSKSAKPRPTVKRSKSLIQRLRKGRGGSTMESQRSFDELKGKAAAMALEDNTRDLNRGEKGDEDEVLEIFVSSPTSPSPFNTTQPKASILAQSTDASRSNSLPGSPAHLATPSVSFSPLNNARGLRERSESLRDPDVEWNAGVPASPIMNEGKGKFNKLTSPSNPELGETVTNRLGRKATLIQKVKDGLMLGKKKVEK